MADKKISELDLAAQINNDAVFPFSQLNNGQETTYKAVLTALAAKIAEGVTFSNLITQAKTLVGAINEVAQGGGGGGAVILIGTTAPTSSQGSDGNLYIQYTEGTGGADDEVDAIYVKLDGVWIGISTGGTGGHTIVDNSGTDLAQRTNLQFIGAYSEDNSTDDTTEVNIVRSMTYADFQQLSASEKKGLIQITDITGGNDDRFQPVIYSEDEREIGVWIDGKPLYEKTYHQTNITISSNSSLTIDDFSTKLPVQVYGILRDTTDNRMYFPSWSYTVGGQANIFYRKNSGNLELRSENDSWGNTWELFTVVRYTKDSDTAGSGTWTPQGVPAVHYSETEQIVGSWIDGSTLYERSFLFEESSETQSKTYNIASYISNASMIVDEEIRLRLGVNANNLIVFGNFQAETYKCECHTSFRASNNTFQLNVNVPNVWKYDKVWYTIRYTKSST